MKERRYLGVGHVEAEPGGEKRRDGDDGDEKKFRRKNILKRKFLFHETSPRLTSPASSTEQVVLKTRRWGRAAVSRWRAPKSFLR
jgi:hypothetical protein